MVSGYEFIKNIVLFSMFYSLVMTLLAYSVSVPAEFSPEKTVGEVSSSLESVYRSSVGVPVIDLGALVFFTGNAVLDFLVNFVTAVPSATTAAIGFALAFTNLPPDVVNLVKSSLYAIGIALYVITLIAIIMNIRSRGAVS